MYCEFLLEVLESDCSSAGGCSWLHHTYAEFIRSQRHWYHRMCSCLFLFLCMKTCACFLRSRHDLQSRTAPVNRSDVIRACFAVMNGNTSETMQLLVEVLWSLNAFKHQAFAVLSQGSGGRHAQQTSSAADSDALDHERTPQRPSPPMFPAQSNPETAFAAMRAHCIAKDRAWVQESDEKTTPSTTAAAAHAQEHDIENVVVLRMLNLSSTSMRASGGPSSTVERLRKDMWGQLPSFFFTLLSGRDVAERWLHVSPKRVEEFLATCHHNSTLT